MAGTIAQLARAKAFENAIESCWKWFKYIAQKEGIEVLSPKDAVRSAAKLKIIANPGEWMDYLDARNYSVHDYFGMDEKTYFQLIDRFERNLKVLVEKFPIAKDRAPARTK